jgi:hypothetical protein
MVEGGISSILLQQTPSLGIQIEFKLMRTLLREVAVEETGQSEDIPLVLRLLLVVRLMVRLFLD